MSEQLKDFGARAETLVEIPDFAEIDKRGRGLRARRRAGVATAAALVIAVAGATVAQLHRPDSDDRPIGPPRTVNASPYPGATMTTLHQGRYWLAPSRVPGRPLAEYADDPHVELTLPKGWNAWAGPNRFDGHAPGRTNNQALGHMTWYVGALALQVTSVNTHGCNDPDFGNVATAEDLTKALTRTFGFRVIRRPEQGRAFGHPATRMRVRITKAIEPCGDNAIVFDSTSEGLILYAGAGWIADIWVVDVDGTPLYVQKIWSPNAPRHARDELDAVIDSIRIAHLE